MENNFGPTSTDLKIKEYANRSQIRSEDQFIQDVQKTISDGIYKNQNEAIKGVLEYAQSKGVKYKGIDSVSLLGEVSTKIVESKRKTLGESFKESGEQLIKASKIPGEMLASTAIGVFEGGKQAIEDIKDFRSGTIGEEFASDEEVERGILGRLLRSGMERGDALTQRKTGRGDALTGFEEGVETFGQGVGFLGDVFGETFISGLKTIATEDQEEAVKDTIKEVLESSAGKKGIETAQESMEAFEDWERENPRIGSIVRTGLNAGLLGLDVLGVKLSGSTGKILRQGGKGTIKRIDNIAEGIKNTIKEGSGVISEQSAKALARSKDIVSDIKLPSLTKELDELPSEMRTEKGLINGLEVEVPVIDRGVAEKITKTFTKDITNKTLAGKAVSPRTVGKNAKQKLSSIANVEKNTKKFYENVRTGILDGDIGTLEEAAQTMVNNIDTVGARIGNAVKKVEGSINFDNKITDDIINALNTKGAEVSPATPVLNKFFESLGDGKLTINEAYELKKAYQNEVTKLFKSGDAGTAQYKALSDGVKFLNAKIDEIIETKLGGEFAKDKELFRSLKLLVDDMVASSLVEGRRSANTLAERIGLIESLFSPVSSTKQKLIQSVDDLNTRGGAWTELIKRYDEAAIKNAKNISKLDNVDIKTPSGINTATQTILSGVDIAKDNIGKATQIVKDFIAKHGEDFKNKIGELMDELADKVGARSKFIDDSGKDFNTTRTAGSAEDIAKAVTKYTDDGGQIINKKIREGNLNAEDNKLISQLDSFIKTADKHSGDSFRGITLSENKFDDFISNIKKNGYTDKAFTSSSNNYGDATTFARDGGGKKGIILQIEGKNGAKISEDLNAFNEEEILFPRNSKFKYIDSYNRDGKTVLIVKE